MTVSSTSNKITFDGNGATTTWPFTFSCEDETDIEVYVTDADGVITEISSSDFTVTLNAAAGANPTPVGGSVEYPLSGSPLAADEEITIIRVIALTQPTSLANQGVLYQPTIEQQFDQLLMQVQQLQEQLGRQFTVPVSDPDPEVLVTAEQRASMLAGFDADGNMIAVELTDAGEVMVSAAMIPVVEAATLALARTALGLGNIAVEDIGAGLEDDGSGNVRVINTPVAVAAGQAVTSAFHLKEYHVTGAATFTNPAASTLFDGFGYYVYALTGAVTFAIDAGDTFSGGTNGQSLIIPAGSRAWVSTDGTLTWFIRVEQLPLAGNYQISASVAGNNLTVAIKDRNGNDPSTASPVILSLRDPTVANGNPVNIAITSALSIVAANGASFGTSNNVAFALWLVEFNDAGTPRLGLINCLTGEDIYPLGQIPIASSTQVSAAATAAWTFYTQGAAVATKAYTILGRLTWESGLASAGAWSAGPTTIDTTLNKLPGDEVQSVRTSTGAVATGSGTIPEDDTVPAITDGDQYMTKAITPRSAANLHRVKTKVNGSNATANRAVVAALFYDAVTNTLGAASAYPDNTVVSRLMWVEVTAVRLAGTQSAITYRTRAGSDAGATFTFNGTAGGRVFGGLMNSYLEIQEVMT